MQERTGRPVSLQAASLPASIRRKARAATAPSAAESSYYVFNVGTGDGFVIVSGDDRTPEILGYADSGSFSEDNMPDGLRWLLDGYAEQMEWLDDNGLDESYEACASRTSRKAPARTAIAPLIKTRWNQGAPYNAYCPEINGEKAVTGCVATSLAQLMYYHKWPLESTTAIPGYTVTTKDENKNAYTLTVPILSAIALNWNAMTNTYADNATGDAADAVAELMQYCGSALQMIYGLRANGGSSSFSENIPYALNTYFGYDGGVRHAYRKAYSYAEWVSLIYSELSDGRPVALGGQATGGGHSFVCDGYQGDDYFHINWGWGGKSDGYYRLSLLNPYEQGIGGSSTLDGFSYSQDAVIGIQPPVSGNKDYFLSLEGLRLGSSDAYSASKTFKRTDGNFTDISLYFLVFCYNQGSTDFDFAVQLVDGNNEVVQTFYEETKTMLWSGYNTGDNNSGRGRTITGISIPSSVADGTYYIKVTSRPNDTDAWQECFDGDRYQLTAVISGDELTITVPIPATVLPSAATIAVTGDTEAEGYLTKGYEQEVTASITGGAIDYHGNVVLRVNGTAVMGKVLDIPAGQTVDAHFSFIPTEPGDNKLTLWNAKSEGTQIGSEATVNIKESDATDNLELSFVSQINNLSSDGKLYGNALRATITVGNTSTTNTYAGKMNCSLRKWTITTTDNGDGSYSISASWISTALNTYPLVVGKNSSKTMAIAFDGLETTDENTRYSVRVTYQNSAIENKVAEGVHLGLDQNEFGTLEVINGYSLGDATGTTTLYAPSAAIDAGNACFVDLTTLGTLDAITVTPSSNPNCLYLLASGATTPSDLTGKNVVKGTTAESIALTDGNDFYSPIDFTAEDISYTRTFSRAATSTGGWNVLYLPFTATTVKANGTEIDWFHSSSDTGKDFWLKTMTGDDSGTVYFDFAKNLTANTPYIIALPGDDFGDKQLTDKPITFTGSNAVISATANGSLNGNSYKFCGSTVGQSHSDAYMLNTTGTRFIKGTATLPAFRAWIEAANISSLSRAALVIGDGDIQGISTIENDKEKNDSWYTLDGRKVGSISSAKKGIYIRNGKMIIR